MPLHDWAELSGWDGVHLLWMTELLRHVKAALPAEFRAYLGTGPALAVGAPPTRPDVAVRTRAAVRDVEVGTASGASVQVEPDVEVAVASLDSSAPALLVERDHRLVAAIELVSPRNKDRPVARATYSNRYGGYLLVGVHLLLVDVHPRPTGFSFADAIADEFQVPNQPSLPPPMTVSYRVGEPAATGGRLLAIWRRSLAAGEPLPTLPLPLDVERSVSVDLESTYHRAAADSYLA